MLEHDKMPTLSFAEIYEQYAPLTLHHICKYVFSNEDAEDILVEVFLALLENPDICLAAPASILAWLRRVAYNKSMDFHRRQKHRSTVALEDLTDHVATIAKEPDPEDQLLYNEKISSLQTYINRLPYNQQQVIYFRFGEEMRCTEIALRLQQTESTIRVWLSRALKSLRNLYKRREED